MNLFTSLCNVVSTHAPRTSGDVFYEFQDVPEGPGPAQLLKALGSLITPSLGANTGPWVAGGAARRILQGQSIENSGDVDVFFKNYRQFHDATEKLNLVAKPCFDSSRAVTYQIGDVKVQLIRRKFYETLKDLFKDFDFSVCQVATDGVRIALTNQAKKDIRDHKLSPAPGGIYMKSTVIGRLLKYVSYGFEPGDEMLAEALGAALKRCYYALWDPNGSAMAIYDEDEEDVLGETRVDEIDDLFFEEALAYLDLKNA